MLVITFTNFHFVLISRIIFSSVQYFTLRCIEIKIPCICRSEITLSRTRTVISLLVQLVACTSQCHKDIMFTLNLGTLNYPFLSFGFSPLLFILPCAMLFPISSKFPSALPYHNNIGPPLSLPALGIQLSSHFSMHAFLSLVNIFGDV